MTKRVPIEEAATASQVREAIANMDDQQLLQIEKYARTMSLKLEETADELLDLTMASIRNPARGRRWRKATVPFMAFLVQSVKGEAWNLYVARKKQRKLDLSESAQRRLKLEPADIRSVGEELQEKEMIETLSLNFKNDSTVLALIEGLCLGLTRAQIMEKGMTSKDYAAGMARFKRGALRLYDQEKLVR